MKAKETRFEKYMKFWYGISGPLDEQKRQVMNQIGNRAYLFLSGSFFVMLMAVNLYIMQQSRKARLTDNEVEKDELPEAKKAAWTKGMISGAIFGILMLILEFLTSYSDGSWTWIMIPTCLISGVFFGIFMSLIAVHRIKVVKDED
ncbi:DUF3278 domain-containing protein [Lactobacillus paragasseri]|uniref:DUF3278 domain-containing protein n=1 Tax=Lactobacillus paragasseri TaxID=2107999 RepID=UPI00321B1A77